MKIELFKTPLVLATTIIIVCVCVSTKIKPLKFNLLVVL